MSVRGIEHVGITVPDVEQASAFFVAAFDAVPLFDLVEPPADERAAAEEAAAWDLPGMLGVRPGTWTRHMRMLRLGDGPNIELFQFEAPAQQQPAVASDLGLQHLGLYVDDVDAAAARVEAAGGTLLSGPHELPGAESGPGNRFHYTRAPWGTTIELVSTPSPQAYEAGTTARRWRPAR